MWETRFFTEFRDDNEGLWRVNIQVADYEGTPTRLTPAGNPLEWKNRGSESITDCILGGSGTLRLLIETEEERALFNTGGVMPSHATDRRVEVWKGAGRMWVGFIQTQSLTQDWESTPVEIELSLMDTVEALKYIYIDKDETATNNLTLIYNAYRKAGGEESYGDFLRTNVQAYTPRPGRAAEESWGGGNVFPEYWNANPDKKKTYADALNVILSPHGRLFQTGKAWFVGREDIVSARLYRPNELSPHGTFVLAEDAPITDISHTIAGSDNSVSIVPPPSKVTRTYSPEEGVINVGGDKVFEISKDLIVGPSVSSIKDVTVPSSKEKLRYLFLREVSGNFTLRRFTRYEQYTAAFGRHTWDTDEIISGGWAQVLSEGSSETTYSVKASLAVVGYREFTDSQASTYRYSVDEIAINIPVYSSGTNMLTIQAQGATLEDMTTSATVTRSSGYNVYAGVYVYFGTQPGEKLKELVNTNSGINWIDTDDQYFLGNFDLNNIGGGLSFPLPDGYQTGYITLELCAGNYYAPTPSWSDAQKTKLKGAVVIKGLSLSYTPVYTDPRTPIDWNKDARGTATEVIVGGMGDVELNFKTLAKATPDASDYFTPRRGFDDGSDCVTNPREMIDIDAVHVPQDNYTIQGVSQFSLFSFDNKTYFPAAIGMNAKDNTAILKLIRTIDSTTETT